MPEPTWRDLAREGVAYDHWANSLWLPIVADDPEGETRQVLHHILSVLETWLARTRGVSYEAPPKVEISAATLDRLRDEWLSAIDHIDFDERITHRNYRGQDTTIAFGDMARQALNHGTYHRGQLRELFGAAGREFPDTDFLLFAFARA